MEQSEQNQQENFNLTINKKYLHNKKEEQINSPNQQKQTNNQSGKLDLLIKQQQNIILDSKDNFNLSKETCQIIEAEDITNEELTDLNHKIISQNENVDLNTSNCINSQKSQKDSQINLKLSQDTYQIIQEVDITNEEPTDFNDKIISQFENIDLNTSKNINSQKSQKDSKNNVKQSKDTYQIIEAGDITKEEPTDINSKIISHNEFVDQYTLNCIKYQKSEDEEERISKIIKQIFDSQGKKMVNEYSEENKKIIYEKLQSSNYILEAYLKSGGEGDVFQGYRTNSENEQQKIAFKIYSFQNQDDFNEEINLIKQFGQHNLIVKVFDSLQIQISYKQLKTQCFILVMELCQFSLFDELNDFKEKQQFSFDQLFKIIFDLLDAVIKLRGHYTLHADIKSKNILKNQDNSYCFTDFGISQKKKSREEKLIFKGGTRAYMAKEQHPNSKLIDFKSDIFSLGKVFQIVIQEFQKINQNMSEEQMNLINKFNQIIQEMLETDVQKRKSAMKIYKSFFKQINKVEYFDFNKYHYNDLAKIIKQNDNLELWKHQDYLYQMNLEHFYDKIKFSIFKITSKDQLFILIQENQIAINYCETFDSEFILQLQKEFLDVEYDWLIELAQKLISDIIILKNQNEYNFNKNKKAKEKLKQCYQKFQSFFSQPNHQLSQKKQFHINIKLANICINLAKCFFIDKNMEEANKFFKESLQFFQKIQYECKQEEEEEKAHLNLEYGEYQLLLNNLKEAENYATKSYHMSQQVIDENLIVVSSLFLLGFICIKKGDFEQAQKYLIQIFSYEQHFENNDIYHLIYLYFLGYSIYLQIREQKAPEIQDLKEDIFKGLEVKYNELEVKKSIQQVDDNDSIEQNLQKAINRSNLNDDEKKVVKEKILKNIQKKKRRL